MYFLVHIIGRFLFLSDHTICLLECVKYNSGQSNYVLGALFHCSSPTNMFSGLHPANNTILRMNTRRQRYVNRIWKTCDLWNIKNSFIETDMK